MAERTKRTRGSIRPQAEVVESTVDDDKGRSGETNVDSPQWSGPARDQGERRAYRVLVNHDAHTVADVIELPTDARTVNLVAAGYLEPLG